VEKNTNTTKYLDFEQIQQSIWILKQSYNKVAGFLSHPTTRIFRKSQSKYFVVYGKSPFKMSFKRCKKVNLWNIVDKSSDYAHACDIADGKRRQFNTKDLIKIDKQLAMYCLPMCL